MLDASGVAWMKATIQNLGGSGSGPIHVAPLLLRTDVSGKPPSLAALPLEVLPPPPGGSGTVVLGYKFPQPGTYRLGIFIAEAHNDGFFSEGTLTGGWYSSKCVPTLEITKLTPGAPEIIGATLHAANTAKCEDGRFCCTTLSPDWLSIRVKNTGHSTIAPFTVDVKVVKGCNNGTAVNADSLKAGTEVDLKAVLPSIPGFQKCLYGSSGGTKTMEFEIGLSIRNSDSSGKIIKGTLYDCPSSVPHPFEAIPAYTLFEIKQSNN